MQNIQTLIFDLGGVILNLKNEKNWFKEDLIPNFHPQKLYQLQQNNFFHDFETGKIQTPDFIRQFKEIALDKFIIDERIIQNWNNVLLDIPKHRIDVLKILSQKYKLILLSNTNQIHLDYIRNYMQQEFKEDILKSNFHYCYYSYEIGLRKPNKEINEYVMNQQNLKSAEILFLDDKAENLIEPQKLGWQTFHVNFNQLSIDNLKYLL